MKIEKVLHSANLSILVSCGQHVYKWMLVNVLTLIVKLDQAMLSTHFLIAPMRVLGVGEK